MEPAKEIAPKRNEISVVAQDKNWRSYIANELGNAERWHADWGFLQAGAIECKFIITIPLTFGLTSLNEFVVTYQLFFHAIAGAEAAPKSRDERIGELENQLKAMNARDYVTSSATVGRGATLEAFPMRHLNIQRQPDLMACPKRPTKK